MTHQDVIDRGPLKPLTDRQREVLSFIERFRGNDASQAPPTRAEIAQHFGWASPNAAEEHLQALARKGYLTLRPGKSRGIVVAVRHDFGPLEAAWSANDAA